MTIAKNRVVSIDYTLTDEKNNLLDSTSGQGPLDYLHGFGNIIPGLEKELEGKSQGDHFAVNISAADAYGERDERLVTDIPLENFKGIEKVEPGMQFHAHDSGSVRVFTITNVADKMVTVDGNHPLAGMNLAFDVTVAAVREASGEELEHGHVHGGGHDEHCGCSGEGCGNEHENCGCGGCCDH